MSNKKKTSSNWPSEEELKKMDKVLAKAKGSYIISDDDNLTDRIKWELCAHFVSYEHKHKLSQKEMAKLVGLSEARMSEILHYRFKRYTIDNLLKYLVRIRPDLKIKVA